MLKLFKILLCLIFSFSFLNKTAFAGAKLLDKEGKWEIYLETDDQGWFQSCWLLRNFKNGESLIFWLYSEERLLGFYNPNWNISQSESYVTILQIDEEKPFTATIQGEEQIVLVEEDISTIIPKIKNGDHLYIHTNNNTLDYKLKGFGDAYEGGQDCVNKYSQTSILNPFAQPPTLSSNQEKTPVERDYTFSPWRKDPIIGLETFGLFFDVYKENELNVETGFSTYSIGDYEAKIEDAITIVYWEEDSTQREIERVATDAISAVQAECDDKAASYVRNSEIHEIAQIRNISFSCLLDDGELYSGITVVDSGSTAFIFIAASTPDLKDAVDKVTETFGLDFMTLLEYAANSE